LLVPGTLNNKKNNLQARHYEQGQQNIQKTRGRPHEPDEPTERSEGAAENSEETPKPGACG
jgi:hypothetical protein